MDGSGKAAEGSLALNEKKVIVIDAAKRPETEKLRVAAYARVSTDSSDQANSFLAQMEHYNRMVAANEGWTMVDVYADKGISGTSAEKRPDFQRMLSDCRRGRIDKILVKSISRFARNTKECLEVVRELKAIGVGVCFEEQNIDTGKVTGELLTCRNRAVPCLRERRLVQGAGGANEEQRNPVSRRRSSVGQEQDRKDPELLRLSRHSGLSHVDRSEPV